MRNSDSAGPATSGPSGTAATAAPTSGPEATPTPSGGGRPRSGRVAAAVPGFVGAGAMGFLVGAVFWHFIGFWGFVREMVLKGPERTLVAQTGPACTAIVLDRPTGQVRADGCPTDAAWLVEGTSDGKGDLAVPMKASATKRWSVTVQADASDE